jgi:hypothetical protein
MRAPAKPRQWKGGREEVRPASARALMTHQALALIDSAGLSVHAERPFGSRVKVAELSFRMWDYGSRLRVCHIERRCGPSCRRCGTWC